MARCPMTAAWPTMAEMTLTALAERWPVRITVEYTPEGRYRATRPDGHVLPEADTPEGLDSAIRADFSRWHSR